MERLGPLYHSSLQSQTSCLGLQPSSTHSAFLVTPIRATNKPNAVYQTQILTRQRSQWICNYGYLPTLWSGTFWVRSTERTRRNPVVSPSVRRRTIIRPQNTNSPGDSILRFLSTPSLQGTRILVVCGHETSGEWSCSSCPHSYTSRSIHQTAGRLDDSGISNDILGPSFP